MPIKGKLERTFYIPGRLFGVDFESQKVVPKLYARNERLITVFDTDLGKMGVIMVGAFLVGGIQPVWMDEPVTDSTSKRPANDVILDKFEELGCFKAGSTIILLFEPNRIDWLLGIKSKELRAGDPLAIIRDYEIHKSYPKIASYA